MRQVCGNWVSGADFWDREDDIRLLTGRIEDRHNILLVAQRRIGKTSLLHELSRRLEDRYLCLFVDVQHCKCSADAIVELSLVTKPHASLWRKTANLFSNALRGLRNAVDGVELKDIRIQLRAGLTGGNWTDRGDRLFAILAGAEVPVLLLLDEVPILVNRILRQDGDAVSPRAKTEADEFMSWLRRNTIRHQGEVTTVLSGSIGLEPVLHQAGLSATLNTFSPFELKPWDKATAMGCLEALAEQYGVTFDEGAAARIVHLLKCCIPHHVQMFFTRVYERCRRRENMMVTAEDVQATYETEMLSVRGHAELTHYEERLEMVLTREHCILALEMLTEAAVVGDLSPDALAALRKCSDLDAEAAIEAQREILNILQHDGYLEQREGLFVFESHLLRDWWQRRYGAFYQPALQREC